MTRTFRAFNREFEYAPCLGERCIEVPLARAVVQQWKPEETVEVGAVLPHESPTHRVAHRVIDLHEPQAAEYGVENLDGCTFDYRGLNVLSVSTLEHFDEVGIANFSAGCAAGAGCLEKIIQEANEYFITLPLGYNTAMDAYLRESGHNVWFFRQISGPTNFLPGVPPTWVQCEKVAWDTEYSSPFHYANGVVVLTNSSWLLS